MDGRDIRQRVPLRQRRTIRRSKGAGTLRDTILHVMALQVRRRRGADQGHLAVPAVAAIPYGLR